MICSGLVFLTFSPGKMSICCYFLSTVLLGIPFALESFSNNDTCSLSRPSGMMQLVQKKKKTLVCSFLSHCICKSNVPYEQNI